MLHSRVSKGTYRDIIDKLHNKLSGWKVKNLSFAGRVTLAQSVLQSVPVFTMQTARIPISVCDNIDRIIRNFVWGSSQEKKRMHLVAWSKICIPKENGGLGLRMARINNEALLMKLGWRLLTETNSIWTKVLRCKYAGGSIMAKDMINKSNDSPTWKGIGGVMYYIRKGVKWIVGNGLRVSFWCDWWLVDVGPLCEQTLEEIPEDIMNLPIAHYALEESGWRWSMFQHLLPVSICFKIAESLPPKVSRGEDKLIWALSPNGRFTVKSAMSILSNQDLHNQDRCWKYIWKCKGHKESVLSCGWLLGIVFQQTSYVFRGMQQKQTYVQDVEGN